MGDHLVDQPQGMACDRAGNVWVAECGGGNVTVIPGGNPVAMWNITNVGSKPFDMAIDTRGHAWVTVNNASTAGEIFPTGIVRELSSEGTFIGEPVTGRDGIMRPVGIASDSLGNVWVADSGILDIPIESSSSNSLITQDVGLNAESNIWAAVTLIQPHGNSITRTVTTFGVQDGPRGGLALPWGVAVDGDDNVFVANFAGQRLTELCGARLKNCPPGKHVGDAISPDTGYTFDGLTRNTGVQIDSSGNVWLMNNWIQDALQYQSNPGGHHVVVFIGLAAPIKTPLIGSPQQQ
jgi:sugar lactone lactonase YvrE